MLLVDGITFEGIALEGIALEGIAPRSAITDKLILFSRLNL
jgi:hypothetical protein